MLYFLILMLYVTVCFVLPNAVFQLLNRKKGMAPAHLILTWIYWIYCAAVLHLTGIGTLWDLIAYGGVTGNIHWLPFSEPATIPNILNMIMMMPFGFLLPLIWPQWRRLWKVIPAGFSFSLLIEVLQLFNLRLSDVDDLIMNTLGAGIGYLVWMIFARLLGGKYGKYVKKIPMSAQTIQVEALVYLLLGTLGVFLLYNWRPVSDFVSQLG